MNIENKGFEVKRSNSYNLSNPISAAKKQPHDIIAIEVDSLEQREIPYYATPEYESTWLGVGNLKDVLNRALNVICNGDVILLFMSTFEGLKGRIILLKQA